MSLLPPSPTGTRKAAKPPLVCAFVATERPNRVGERAGAGNAQGAEPRQNLKRGAGGARRRPTTEQRIRDCAPLGWGVYTHQAALNNSKIETHPACRPPPHLVVCLFVCLGVFFFTAQKKAPPAAFPRCLGCLRCLRCWIRSGSQMQRWPWLCSAGLGWRPVVSPVAQAPVAGWRWPRRSHRVLYFFALRRIGYGNLLSRIAACEQVATPLRCTQPRLRRYRSICAGWS
jgi:hypothetical protein